jgi:hypothetical protein
MSGWQSTQLTSTMPSQCYTARFWNSVPLGPALLCQLDPRCNPAVLGFACVLFDSDGQASAKDFCTVQFGRACKSPGIQYRSNLDEPAIVLGFLYRSIRDESMYRTAWRMAPPWCGWQDVNYLL